MLKTYSRSDALRLVQGLTENKTTYWGDRALIVPDIGGGGAKGKHRQYSFRNLFEFALALKLDRFHLTTDEIARALRTLRTLERGRTEDGTRLSGEVAAVARDWQAF